MLPKISDIAANAYSRFGLALVVIDNKVNAKKHAKRHADNVKFEELMKNRNS